jgi:gluconate 2-dehydrogenase gamma chain
MCPSTQTGEILVLKIEFNLFFSKSLVAATGLMRSEGWPMQAKNKGGSLTRRQFLAASALCGAALAAGCKTDNKGDWDFLTDAEARTLTPICDQIIPEDAFPSASQAGVLRYIDRQLFRHYRPHRDAYRVGIEQANAMSRKQFGKDLADTAPLQQLDIVSTLEKQNPIFFDMVRKHTMEGYYGSPRHGGNVDGVSWRMLGLAEPPVRGRAQYDLRKGATS